MVIERQRKFQQIISQELSLYFGKRRPYDFGEKIKLKFLYWIV